MTAHCKAWNDSPLLAGTKIVAGNEKNEFYVVADKDIALLKTNSETKVGIQKNLSVLNKTKKVDLAKVADEIRVALQEATRQKRPKASLGEAKNPMVNGKQDQHKQVAHSNQKSPTKKIVLNNKPKALVKPIKKREVSLRAKNKREHVKRLSVVTGEKAQTVLKKKVKL